MTQYDNSINNFRLNINQGNKPSMEISQDRKLSIFDMQEKCVEEPSEFSFSKKDSLPKDAEREIDFLKQNGMKAGVDFSVRKEENGDYVIEYLTNKARGYGSVSKRIFHKDGKQSVIASALYKENTEERWDKFNIEDTDFVNKLYKRGEKNTISDAVYTQKINNAEYKAELAEDKILISKDDKQYSIDTSNISEDMKQVLFHANPAVLYRIAQQGITVKFEKTPTGGDAEWVDSEKTIYIEPSADAQILQRRIAHEAGHSYYTDSKPINEELEEMFAQESDDYSMKIFEIRTSVEPGKNYLETGAKEYEALKKFDKYAPDMDNTRYCAKNVYEFVAEAYCLLVTGDAKSEFTIAKVYPKTFELVKKMIEEENLN